MKEYDVYDKIIHDPDLRVFELKGFARGKQRGKTMSVSLYRMVKSLRKQMEDFAVAYVNNDLEDMKQCLADIRNVAGCVFVKLKEKEIEK